jgi:dTDP-4-dehydrorhamnose 3,5-epimerase
MKIIRTDFEGLLIITPDVITDERGYFFERIVYPNLRDYGIRFIPVQENESYSTKGVARGLHYQTMNTQAKFIKVISGRILDISLDLRLESKTYGQYFEKIIDTSVQLLIPRGFAHGFRTLRNETIVQYVCDNIYNPEYAKGFRFPNIKEDDIINERDKNYPIFSDEYFRNQYF